MKKILAVLLTALMLLTLVSCSGKEDEQYEIVASYSMGESEDDFVVYVQDLGGVYEELYDEKGLYIKMKKDAKIYDSEGNEITKDDLKLGDTLVLNYTGKLIKNNPKTIKVNKITKLY